MSVCCKWGWPVWSSEPPVATGNFPQQVKHPYVLQDDWISYFRRYHSIPLKQEHKLNVNMRTDMLKRSSSAISLICKGIWRLSQMVSEILSNLQNGCGDNLLKGPINHTPLHKDIRNINNVCLAELPGEERKSSVQRTPGHGRQLQRCTACGVP